MIGIATNPHVPVRVAPRILEAIQEIESDLATLVEGGPPALARITPALTEILGTKKTASYGLGPRGKGLRVEWGFMHGLPEHSVSAFDAFVGTQGIDWAAYNPVRPEPPQRNKAYDSPRIANALGIRWDEITAYPLFRDFFCRVGLHADHQLRVLVCDGASLLAWVGAFRETPFTDVERCALQRLARPLQRRLVLERLLETARATRAVLDVALDAIPAPAFVTDTRGVVLEANTAGRRWLGQEGRAGRASLREAATGRPNPSWTITPLVARGASARRLIVMRPGAEPSGACRVAVAAARWGLTARQAEVLAPLVEGLSTRTIAASLGISERAVELHLTAMFEKAQVESRTELAAAVWRMTL
jgi:DNA-binding CsgD family transcriptional regulator